jgi:hypothetical protein
MQNLVINYSDNSMIRSKAGQFYLEIGKSNMALTNFAAVESQLKSKKSNDTLG